MKDFWMKNLDPKTGIMTRDFIMTMIAEGVLDCRCNNDSISYWNCRQSGEGFYNGICHTYNGKIVPRF